jgi:hypothetical protein
MGRRSGLNGRTALHASIVDAMSMSDVSTDVAYLDQQSQNYTSEGEFLLLLHACA